MRSKMDWLSLEFRIRESLDGFEKDCLKFPHAVDQGQFAIACLFHIAEIIGEETGRGYPLEGLNKDLMGK